MPYVSCRYGPPPSPEVPQQQIICTDDYDQQWWLFEDCQVGDWIDYVAAGGTVDPYEPPEEPDAPTGD